MIKNNDRLIAAIWDRDQTTSLLTSTMSGSGEAYRQMLNLIHSIASQPTIELSEGKSLAYRGQVAIVLSPSSEDARQFLIFSANAILDSQVPDEAHVTIIEWGSDLVSLGIVEAKDIPPPENAVITL